MYPWHEASFQSVRAGESRLAHAILLQAPDGTGLFGFAMAWAQALLCESAGGSEQACDRCLACGWFIAGNHPDFRLVQPDSHVVEADAPADGAAPVATTAREREKKSDQIRIDQVRELAGFLNIGTHRAGRRVVVLHPADTMNTATQNALLKNLEEPAPGTIFMLASARSHRLLPTVRSRCQTITLPRPAPESALQWLQAEGVADAEGLLGLSGGAPLLALELAERADFLDQLAGQLANRRFDPLLVAALCQRAPPVEVVTALYRWCYDLLSSRLGGGVRYHAARRAAVDALAASCSPRLIAAYLRQLARARSLAEHPLNPRLFMEDLMLGYLAMLEGRAARPGQP